MKRLRSIYLVAGLLISAGLFLYGIKYPTHLYAPGDLSKAHSAIKECGDCHKPFRQAPSSMCMNAQCHPSDKLADPLKPKGAFHSKVTGTDCIACHTEHKGISGRITAKFDHDVFAEYAKECASCHKPPADDIHQYSVASCSVCHTTSRWSPAEFKHEKFPITGDHKTTCLTCHAEKDYEKYTCLGCHEHNTQKIRQEHEEEGIRNYGDCLRCHRFSIDGRSYGTGKIEAEEDDD